MRISNLFLGSLALGGCTLGNFASIHRSVDMTNGATQIVDAEQRLIVSYPSHTPDVEWDASGSKWVAKAKGPNTICAEPSPDTFSVLAASGEFRVDTTKVGVGGSGAFAETGASLIDRTTSLQALRDAYFRMCEARANDWIDDTDLMVGQRHNQTALIGLLAIEGLTRAVMKPATIIGGQAAAVSANGIAQIANLMKSHEASNRVIETRLGAITTEDGQADGAINAINGSQKTDAEKAAERKPYEEKKAALKAEKQRLEAEKASNDKIIASLQNSLQSVSTGSSAGSVTPVSISIGHAPTDMTAVAQTVENIVREIDDNDFGPTICLHRLLNGSLSAEQSSVCTSVVESYTKSLDASIQIEKDKASAYIALLRAFAEKQKLSMVDIKSLAQILGGIDGRSVEFESVNFTTKSGTISSPP